MIPKMKCWGLRCRLKPAFRGQYQDAPGGIGAWRTGGREGPSERSSPGVGSEWRAVLDCGCTSGKGGVVSALTYKDARREERFQSFRKNFYGQYTEPGDRPMPGFRRVRLIRVHPRPSPTGAIKCRAAPQSPRPLPHKCGVPNSGGTPHLGGSARHNESQPSGTRLPGA